MTQVHTGGVSNRLPPAGLRTELEEWSAFFVRHAQRLEQCHNVLFGLARLDGPPSMRQRCDERLEAAKWKLPWIRATAQWVPSEDQEASEGIEIIASLEFSTVTAAALAPAAGIGFVVAGVGRVGRLDLRRGRGLEPDLTVRRERVLQLACSEEGRYLAISFESGVIDVVELEPDKDGVHQDRLIWSAHLRLPLYEPPTIQFLNSKLWFQLEAGDVVGCDVTTGEIERRFAPPEGLVDPELTGVICVQDTTVMAWRGEGGSRLVAFGGSSEQSSVARAPDIVALNRFGNDRVAASFNDGRLSVYGVHPSLQLQHELLLEVPAACLVECGSRLCWTSNDERMYCWTGTGKPEPVWTSGLSFGFASGLALTPNGDGLVLTPNLAAAFRLGGRVKRNVMFQSAYPRSDGYVALAVMGGGYVIVDAVEHVTIPVVNERTHGVGARADGREIAYLFAVDGEGRVLVSGGGAAELWDSSTGERLPCQIPDGTISATGKQTSGFWLVDLQGRIYSLDGKGTCREVAQASREVLGPPRLGAWDGLVVWTGTRVATRSTLGRDAVYAQVFFRSTQDRLDRIGEREYTAADGILQTDSWDKARGRLISIWQAGGRESASVKIGSPEAFITGTEEDRLLPGIGGNCQEAAITQDPRRLFVLMVDGAIRCFDLDTFASVASLACSERFTRLSGGNAAESEVVVVAGRQWVFRLRCEKGGSE